MENQNPNPQRPVNPRRRKRSKFQIFKETYLPVIIAGIAGIFIITLIAGAASRNSAQEQAALDASIAQQEAANNESSRLQAEVDLLLTSSAKFAASYDYDRAIAVIDTFSGNINSYPELANRRQEYEAAKNDLVAWEDPSKVINLCFQPLIVDSERAFTDDYYGQSYRTQYVTTSEFSRILTQLYENDYILVSLDDFIITETTATGTTVYHTKPMYLPEGKKPLMITQVNVNFQTYMIDGDKDGYADKDGAGFASKLVLDNTNKLTCEMVGADGQTTTGAYDLVPILDAFIEQHPDFSYKGSMALLALTGYDGLFGYRTNSEAERVYGTAQFELDIQEAEAVAEALRLSGYELACYTYNNIPYGDRALAEIQADLSGWIHEVTPILGKIDILVYAQGSDIASPDAGYSGEKYNALFDAGFRYYIGFCADGEPWLNVNDNYVRQGRILVTSSNIKDHPDWFTGIFDANTVLDPERP